MRLRKKKNLEQRLTAVDDYMIVKEGSDFYYNPARKNEVKIDLDKAFAKSGKLYLELGCGKGAFVCEMAKKYPNSNFIALEKVPNVIVSACERAKSEGLDNVKFVLGSAENLTYFLDNDTIDGIFLNFCLSAVCCYNALCSLALHSQEYFSGTQHPFRNKQYTHTLQL